VSEDTKCPKHDTGDGPCYCNKESMTEDKLLPCPDCGASGSESGLEYAGIEGIGLVSAQCPFCGHDFWADDNQSSKVTI